MEGTPGKEKITKKGHTQVQAPITEQNPSLLFGSFPLSLAQGSAKWLYSRVGLRSMVNGPDPQAPLRKLQDVWPCPHPPQSGSF